MTQPPDPTPAKSAFILEPEREPGWRLRTAGLEDGELLRQWKNANQGAFFHREEITPEQQARWLAGYLERPWDFIFMVEAEGRVVGCLGWRLLDDGQADVYNVIRGVAGAGCPGLMGKALALMCGHIMELGHAVVTAKVVSGNPALGWYMKNGFVLSARLEGFDLVSLDTTNFTALPARRTPFQERA